MWGELHSSIQPSALSRQQLTLPYHNELPELVHSIFPDLLLIRVCVLRIRDRCPFEPAQQRLDGLQPANQGLGQTQW